MDQNKPPESNARQFNRDDVGIIDLVEKVNLPEKKRRKLKHAGSKNEPGYWRIPLMCSCECEKYTRSTSETGIRQQH
jgi:hypothetical protein